MWSLLKHFMVNFFREKIWHYWHDTIVSGASRHVSGVRHCVLDTLRVLYAELDLCRQNISRVLLLASNFSSRQNTTEFSIFMCGYLKKGNANFGPLKPGQNWPQKGLNWPQNRFFKMFFDLYLKSGPGF